MLKSICSQILSYLAFGSLARMDSHQATWEQVNILFRRVLAGYWYPLKKFFYIKHLPSHPVIVVIPTHKTSELSAGEVFSLKQCAKIFGNKYPIELVTKKGNDVSQIKVHLPQAKITFLAPENFKSTESYNKMLVTPSFYERYLNYKYIFIYQTDALVFKDELDDWCQKNYDYIGAPWLDLSKINVDNLISVATRDFPSVKWRSGFFVGNGGLSLRKTRVFYESLNRFYKHKLIWDFVHEDSFWGFFAPMHYPRFRLPSPEVALRFSFETLPDKAFALNNNSLPFGCHAWEKYNPEFWQKQVPSLKEIK